MSPSYLSRGFLLLCSCSGGSCTFVFPLATTEERSSLYLFKRGDSNKKGPLIIRFVTQILQIILLLCLFCELSTLALLISPIAKRFVVPLSLTEEFLVNASVIMSISSAVAITIYVKQHRKIDPQIDYGLGAIMNFFGMACCVLAVYN